MNTKNLKAYAPKARREFIAAVKKRAAQFGIYEDRIEEVRIEGGAAIIDGRAFTRKEGEQRKRLESKIAERTSATYQEKYDMFIREMAYTWFNRLAAIRYMELHDYFDHGFRVLSPAKSNTSNPDGLPEILSHASDVADSLALDKSHIIELQLAGDKEEALYRELLLGQCHQLAKIMPQIFKGLGFEALEDATELLLPNNLTKTDSILKGLINDIPEEDWQEIEVIGWLYQFYISEHKDAVIGKVVKSEDIPAATQLFTPNWIVKYLVQNSLGRQWLATYPDSKLVEALKETDRKKKVKALEFKGETNTNHIEGDVYYIEPAEQSEEVIEQLKAITPTSIDPEEIKVLDPACGSGHILVEVYEVLREIYLERGYRLREIPELILTKNIYGLDIDDRAAQLAGFALMMKAREDDRRIFQRVEDGEVSLNVFSLQSTEGFDITTIWKGLDLEGNQQIGSTGGLFDESTDVTPANAGIYKEYFELLKTLKTAFLQAKTLGSLIQIDSKYLDNLLSLKQRLLEKLANSDTQSKPEVEKILPIVNQAIVLAQKYDAVCANPPYMGSKYQTPIVKQYLKDNFKGYEKDLFSAFIVRNLQLAKHRGELGFMTPFVWMFISSYEELRAKLIEDEVISTLIQLEYSGFDGATVPICTFTLTKGHVDDYVGSYIRLSDFKGAANQGPKTLEAIQNRACGWFFDAKPDDFKKIPGSPIAYWVDDDFRNVYSESSLLSAKAHSLQGMITGDNNKFLRLWHEVNADCLSLNKDDISKVDHINAPWIPYNKGGEVRKWYGNNEYVLNWRNQGKDLTRSRTQNSAYYLKQCVTWTFISSSFFASRFCPVGSVWDVAGSSAFPKNAEDTYVILSLMASPVGKYILDVSNPTLNYQVENILALPLHSELFENTFIREKLKENTLRLIELSKWDWDSSERSWDYKAPELVNRHSEKLADSMTLVLENNDKKVTLAYELELENLNILSKIYKVRELTIPKEHITLFANIKFMHGMDSEAENQYKSVLVQECISYSIGLMMGRYSLDREGLVYAHSGNEGFKDLEAEGAYKTFPADDDGIIPLASEEWLFDDDATSRFKEFVKAVWGGSSPDGCGAHLSENLEFVAESLCLYALKPKKGESAMDTIRRYFSTQFFKEHCKTYKKRPIYWLFSSGKEKAFECLVYLHRYNEGTLSRMRTEYVTPLMGKYDAQLARLSDDMVNATGSEARRIEKDIKALEKKQAELRTFDEQLKHYAEKRITLDLDDGVKENYGKFGNLLADVKNIHGKAVK
ncbi:BREX-1 system adenine-specific DNA-methyltransferase PglX [Pseudoalteromonas sp. MQS005]|uniref:BREX-1 system adenine-specific DNA-methyltransferase PglX n=1 Tax=Pseudoalteromonas sp. MQS005 TaxID=1854052 RepID=UPI0007E50B1E|nr:BREX-1 system adenine-specific DNA-methyltransferase PglX [Pseudoalteromonas sp. MQS005]